MINFNRGDKIGNNFILTKVIGHNRFEITCNNCGEKYLKDRRSLLNHRSYKGKFCLKCSNTHRNYDKTSVKYNTQKKTVPVNGGFHTTMNPEGLKWISNQL